eukprot:1191417-Amphidinium_carterae.1
MLRETAAQANIEWGWGKDGQYKEQGFTLRLRINFNDEMLKKSEAKHCKNAEVNTRHLGIW